MRRTGWRYKKSGLCTNDSADTNKKGYFVKRRYRVWVLYSVVCITLFEGRIFGCASKLTMRCGSVRFELLFLNQPGGSNGSSTRDSLPGALFHPVPGY